MPEINTGFIFWMLNSVSAFLGTKVISVRLIPENRQMGFFIDKLLLYFCSILVEAFQLLAVK
jgi:hypothetical protein